MHLRRRLATVLYVLAISCTFFAGNGALAQEQDRPLVIPPGPLNLLQPLDDSTDRLQPEPGIDIFFTYFNISWPLIVGSAAGVGVLQALYGGIQIMLSGSDTGRLEEGKSRLLWALAGLLMIGLSGMILETLNPIFFVQS